MQSRVYRQTKPPYWTYLNNIIRLYQQNEDLCGATAMAIVLRYYGIRTTQHRVIKNIQRNIRPHIPVHARGKGDATNILELALYARQKNFNVKIGEKRGASQPNFVSIKGLSVIFSVDKNPTVGKLAFKYIDNGIPVIVLQKLTVMNPNPHFRVVYGYRIVDKRGKPVPFNQTPPAKSKIEFLIRDPYEKRYSKSDKYILSLIREEDYFIKFWKDFNLAYLAIIPRSYRITARVISQTTSTYKRIL